MASTYEITNQSSYTQVLLKEGANTINRFAFAKGVSIRVRNGALEIYQGNKLVTPRIPRVLVSIPASADDEELFNNLSFMSEGGSGGDTLEGYQQERLLSTPVGGNLFVDLNEPLPVVIGVNYLLKSRCYMKGPDDSAYSAVVESQSFVRFYDNGSGVPIAASTPNTVPEPALVTGGAVVSSFLIASNGLFYKIQGNPAVPALSCRLLFSIIKF